MGKMLGHMDTWKYHGLFVKKYNVDVIGHTLVLSVQVCWMMLKVCRLALSDRLNNVLSSFIILLMHDGV